MKIYYKQQQFLRQAHRQIKNYDTNNNNHGADKLPNSSSSSATASASSLLVPPSTSSAFTASTNNHSTQTSTASESIHNQAVNNNRRSRNVISTHLGDLNPGSITGYLNSYTNSSAVGIFSEDDDAASLPDLLPPQNPLLMPTSSTSSLTNETYSSEFNNNQNIS